MIKILIIYLLLIDQKILTIKVFCITLVTLKNIANQRESSS